MRQAVLNRFTLYGSCHPTATDLVLKFRRVRVIRVMRGALRLEPESSSPVQIIAGGDRIIAEYDGKCFRVVQLPEFMKRLLGTA